jgi:hypothetical protein
LSRAPKVEAATPPVHCQTLVGRRLPVRRKRRRRFLRWNPAQVVSVAAGGANQSQDQLAFANPLRSQGGPLRTHSQIAQCWRRLLWIAPALSPDSAPGARIGTAERARQRGQSSFPDVASAATSAGNTPDNFGVASWIRLLFPGRVSYELSTSTRDSTMRSMIERIHSRQYLRIVNYADTPLPSGFERAALRLRRKYATNNPTTPPMNAPTRT